MKIKKKVVRNNPFKNIFIRCSPDSSELERLVGVSDLADGAVLEEKIQSNIDV